MSAGNWSDLERRFGASVKLARRPVAVAFLDSAPTNVAQFSGTEPSGCSFWRLAAAGRTFYTVPENHFNCAVGAYTHNIALSPEREKETEQTLKMMFESGLREAGRRFRRFRDWRKRPRRSLCATRRIAGRAGCGFVRLQAFRGDADS